MEYDMYSLSYAEFLLKYAKNSELLETDPVRPYTLTSAVAREMPFYIVCNECKLDRTLRVLVERIEALECLLTDGAGPKMEEAAVEI
jgi:hypothetical protein